MAWNSQPGAYSTTAHTGYYGSAGYTYPSASTGARQADGYAYQTQDPYNAAGTWSSAQGYARDHDSARSEASSSAYYGRQGDSDDPGASSETSRPQYRRVAWTPEEDHVLLNIIEELCRVALWKAVKEEGGLVHRNANGIRTRTAVLLNKIRR